ncbi:outer membrane protein assembly factor BamB family protein [Methylobrevis albus]|uniref:PQQ-binding-like beta-propeller repeat protein n=1 Tax=Methylobrevis albus TaxID=2793297 RepID=A0A931I5P4_9HYPH|nr:PQQ-binding-like beta-propeller repeat protein [Methylobrevis albus]MBH0239929.1 PQQ-binding-like beta-propeller repeat protein [Methylobrevis albus]
MRRSAILFLSIAAVGLAGCGSDGIDSVGDLNPFKPAETRLPGERRAVLPNGDPTLTATNRTAPVGAASALGDWTQPGGNASNDPGNVAFSGGGSRIWSVRAGQPGSAGSFGFGGSGLRVSARPIIAGGQVIVYDPAGNVSAHSLSSGGRAWSTSLRPTGEDAVAAGGGVAAAGGRIFAATGFSTVAALDQASGATLWTAQLDSPARTAPAVAGGKVYVVTRTNGVIALDQASGAVAWTVETAASSAGLLASASPAVAGDTVVVPTSSGDIVGLSAADGAQKWIFTVAGGSRTMAVAGLGDASASPVVHDGVVYATGVGGRMVAARLATGETIWEQPIGSAHTPVVSGGAVFLVDLDGRAVAFDRSNGTVLWQVALPRPADARRASTWAGPLLAGGRLWFVANDGNMTTVDAATGQIGSTISSGTAGAIAPVSASGTLVVLGADGTLSGFN